MRMPRTPAVFERKREWKLDEAGDVAPRTKWAESYTSAKERPEILLKQFHEDASEGMMIAIKLGDAKA
eukprot:510218-Heterocapsa_arctica.AAC.1